MRKLKLKNDHNLDEMTLEVHDYVGNKDVDWRMSLKSSKTVIVGHEESDADGKSVANKAEVELSTTFYGLNEKDLDKMDKWIQRSKKRNQKS